MIKNKGQEEITGFVAIVVIVTIIGVILLGFLMRGSSDNNDENRDIMRYLESINVYTTDCSSDYSEMELRKLIKECYDEPMRTCPNGENVCLVLNNTLKALLNSGWGEVDNSSYIKSYKYSAVLVRNSSLEGYIEESIVLIEEGYCSGGEVRGYTLPISANPKIESRLRICTQN